MTATAVAPLFAGLAGADLIRWALCGGIVVLWLALLAMMLTRWGQVRPIAKCAALSLFAHLLLGGYAYVTNLLVDVPGPGAPSGTEEFASLRIVDETSGQLDQSPQVAETPTFGGDSATAAAADAVPRIQPWEQFSAGAPSLDAGLTLVRRPRVVKEWERSPAPLADPLVSAVGFEVRTPEALERATANESPTADVPELPAPAMEIAVAPPSRQEDAPLEALASNISSPTRRATTSVRERAAPRKPSELAAKVFDRGGQTLPERIEATGEESSLSATGLTSSRTASAAPYLEAALLRPLPRRLGDGQEMPNELRFRAADERAEAAHHLGGNERTEKAVRAALEWLAAAQRPTGEWDAASFGAGRETRAMGQDRSGVGADANAGVTGLALLAYLGAGHTHLEGDFRKVVKLGLEYLLRVQAADGNLAGPAQLYAHMYCHGMATLALSEALAMTGDARLRPAVEHAVGYTVAAQHSGGGWRYLPRDRGDMSQFGWQVMALRSAQLAGVDVPEKTRRAMLVFLDSVSSGRHRGLASYRQNEATSRTMTAEALLCRLLLPANPSRETIDEAVTYIFEELPGQGEPNEYYWYYATLALHQLQGEDWRRWNEALQETVLARQQVEGRFAGSWNPDTQWSGYGGRVYSTAMGALCLEAYYRYLPREATAAATADAAAVTPAPAPR